MIDAYLTDVVTIKTRALDPFGEITETSRNVPARVVFNQKRVSGPGGQDIISQGHILLPERESVSIGMLCQYGGTDWIIVAIEQKKDLTARVKKVFIK